MRVALNKLVGAGRGLTRSVRGFACDERGATAIEYSLIVALIFLAIIAAMNSFASSTNDMYSDISSALN